MMITGFLNFIQSDNLRLVICGTGLAIATAGTVHLVQRLRRSSELEDSQNLEVTDDQSDPTDPMAILDQGDEETRVVACQQMHTYTWWKLAVRGCIIGTSVIIIIAVIRLGYLKRFIASLRLPSAFALTDFEEQKKVKKGINH